MVSRLAYVYTENTYIWKDYDETSPWVHLDRVETVSMENVSTKYLV